MMPIGPLPPGCVALCAPQAVDASSDISAAGACEVATGCIAISNVTITGCTVDGVHYQRVTTRAMGLTITYTVHFTFTGTSDGFTFQGRGTCSDSVFVVQVLTPTHGATLLTPPDCAANLRCTAQDAGFDPERSVQSFIVRLSGSVTCVACGGEYTIVKACPPLDDCQPH